MKNLKKIFVAALFIITTSMAGLQAQNLQDVLSGLGKGGLGTVLNNVLGKSDVTVADLQGTWTYVEPAVAFKSDNLLKKAGGAAAATTIVNKIKPYYERVGLNKMELTINADSTFVMKSGMATLKGDISKAADGNFIFNFKALGKVKVGKMTAIISKTATGNISLTFDASKLITLVDRIASISGVSSLKTVSKMLNSYDGLNLGFILKKTSAANSRTIR
ncbi:MAG: DUF4923 family protein [Muribaculaceae bacterium]|nr:DUF4923 family protein [Muribaculaceae bacterium]